MTNSDDYPQQQTDLPEHRAVLGPDDTEEVRLRHPMANIVRYNRTIAIGVIGAVAVLGLALAYSLRAHHATQPSFQNAPPVASFAAPVPEQSGQPNDDTGIPTPPPPPQAAAGEPPPTSRQPGSTLNSSADRLAADLAGAGGHQNPGTQNASDAAFSPPPLAQPQPIPQEVPEPGGGMTPKPRLSDSGFYIGQGNFGQNGAAPATSPPSSTVATAENTPAPTASGAAPAAQRIAWANGDSAQAPYLTSLELPAVSRYELWAGSTIPAELDTGINTDLPGPVVAHVTDNVYDSRTQHDLLIPSGTRILGRYNSQITTGQARVQVAWDELIFPDGRTIQLSGMPAATTEGDSGLYADVNNHIGTLITTTIITGVLDGASTLAQNGQTIEINPVTGQETGLQPGTAIAEGLANSVSSTGAELVRQHANLPPELTVPKGERFLVVADKTIVLQPYIPDRISP